MFWPITIGNLFTMVTIKYMSLFLMKMDEDDVCTVENITRNVIIMNLAAPACDSVLH